MGLILDLAVVALTLVVLGSLALLGWTVAVGGARATAHGQGRIDRARNAITGAEARLRAMAETGGEGTSE